MKKGIIVLSVVFITVLILFFPFKMTSYDDGGTREYSSLTYKIVKWKRFASTHNDDVIEPYSATSVYWFPDNFKSIDELWEKKNSNK